MRIAISGTHFMGKSTFIEDFINKHPDYKTEVEPYYKLLEEKAISLALEPELDNLLDQLDCSIEQLHTHSDEPNIIFDRCPVDYIAYAMCVADQDSMDINDTEISERFPEVKEALDNLDMIIFLPVTNEHLITYTEENPAYRRAADLCFKKIYRDDICDIFPRYAHPRIVEIYGDRATRIKKLETLL